MRNIGLKDVDDLVKRVPEATAVVNALRGELKVAHVCVLDRECWKHFWQFGMPMRVHFHTGAYWTIPVLSQVADWRTDRVWGIPRTLADHDRTPK